MADLADLKIAVWQREVRDDSSRQSRQAELDAVARAEALGADCLVAHPLDRDRKSCIIPCNGAHAEGDTHRIDLRTSKSAFSIGLEGNSEGCDFTVRLQSEPWTLNSRFDSKEIDGIPSLAVGYVGMRNAGHAVRCYDGGSAAHDSFGNLQFRLRSDFEEDFSLVTLADEGTIAPQCDKKLLCALVATIRRFDTQVLGGSSPWIIGLSGGLDSSIVATLLVRALGADRVLGYNMPTRHNTSATKDNAARLAEALGISFATAPIQDIVNATADVLEKAGYAPGKLAGLALENAQARARGNMLATFASIEGGVIANNANFVEAALGYCTLYGDSVGAFAPIADLTKVELFDLARDLNDLIGTTVIPENLLPTETEDGYIWETMPSAELADGQRDPMKWFYHDWLVRKLKAEPETGAADVLSAYSEDGLASCGMAKWVRFYGLNDPQAFISDLEWVLRSMHRATFKRIQAAPALLVTSIDTPWGDAEVQRAWEPDEQYEELKRQILQTR